MARTSVRSAVVSLGLTATFLVAACSGSATPAPTAAPTTAATAAASAAASAAPTPEGKKGGTVYMLMTTATANADQFTDMDPQRIYTGEDLAFLGATIMQSLTAFKYSKDPKVATSLVGDAATDTGTASADSKTWSFTLRDGLKWQDGSAVKCEDFKYGVSRTFATQLITNGPTYAITYLDVPEVKGFTKAKDGTAKAATGPAYVGPFDKENYLYADNTLTKKLPNDQAAFDKAVSCDGKKITFKLNQPVGDFNYAVTLGFGAVPNPVDHKGADTGEAYTTAPWSNGPYKIDTYQPGKGGNLTLVRNTNWNSANDGGYRGAFPDKWVVQLGLDPAVVDQRLMQPTGNDSVALQYGNIQPENFTKIFSDARTAKSDFAGRAFSDYDVYVRYIWIRTDKVTNVKIRQAMAVALDRAGFRANAGGEFYGDYGDGVIKPNLGADYAPTGWATNLFGQAIPAGGDVALAKKLIAESGVPAPTLTYDYGKSPVGDKNAAIVQASLQAAGFTIKLNPITSGYYAFVQNPETQHEFGTAGWGADWPNASTVIGPLFTPNGGFEMSRVSDPAYIAKVKDALGDSNRASQNVKWQNLNKEAALNAFIIPTVFGLKQTMAGPGLGNLYFWAPFSSWPYAQVYIK